MRNIKALLMATLLVAGLAAPASASITFEEAKAAMKWPTACPSNSEGKDKQAIKMWANDDFNGRKEIECGNPYAPTYHDNNTEDSNFAWVSGVGNVAGFDGDMDSVIMFNRSTNFGACFVFYWNVGYTFRKLTYWVYAKPTNTSTDHVVRWVPDVGFYGTAISSFRVLTEINSPGMTKSKCEDSANPPFGDNYPQGSIFYYG